MWLFPSIFCLENNEQLFIFFNLNRMSRWPPISATRSISDFCILMPNHINKKLVLFKLLHISYLLLYLYANPLYFHHARSSHLFWLVSNYTSNRMDLEYGLNTETQRCNRCDWWICLLTNLSLPSHLSWVGTNQSKSCIIAISELFRYVSLNHDTNQWTISQRVEVYLYWYIFRDILTC